MSKQYEQDKQKYEREIEEILAKYDLEAEQRKATEKPAGRFTNIPQSRYPGPRRSPSFTPPNLKRMTSGQYMGAAFAVAILAVFLHNVVPALASFLVIVAAVLFLVPILLYWNKGSSGGSWSPGEEKRWRGQVIDINTRRDISDDPFASIKRWLRRR